MKIEDRKVGLSGIMRVKNEGRFLGTCIDTIIDALDELIVVYNDCTDDTEAILHEKVELYGNKIKIYPFNHNILFTNLTLEQYEYAISLPEDSPRLFCTQCNYAIEKTSFQYVVKIDPDQIYFADEVRKWRDACLGKDVSINFLQVIIARFFRLWFSFYRRVSTIRGKVCTYLMPDWLISICKRSYLTYGRHMLYKGKISIAWSGLNVFVEDGEIFIPYDYRNIHPPYNGEGDLVLFKVSPETRFGRYLVPGDKTKVLEYMNNPYPMFFSGIIWFHLHANRDSCIAKVSRMKSENPQLFIPIDEFLNYSYNDSLKKMGNGIPTLFQRTLFLLVHKLGITAARRNLPLLRPVILRIFDKEIQRINN